MDFNGFATLIKIGIWMADFCMYFLEAKGL